MSAKRLIVAGAALVLYLALFATPAFGQRPPNTHSGAWFSNVDVLVQFFEETTLTGVLITLGLGFH